MIKLDPDDLKVYTYSHPHTAAYVVHIPTGLSVLCNEHRSPHKNKRQAIEELTAKVDEASKPSYRR